MVTYCRPDIFSIPVVGQPRRRREPKPIVVNGVELHVEQHGSRKWVAWWGFCSDSWEAPTRREVIADAMTDAPKGGAA